MKKIKDMVQGQSLPLQLKQNIKSQGNRINLVALGDVGVNLLIGLKTLGGDVIDTLGIYDLNENAVKRCEMELNQIGWPFEGENSSQPKVKAVTEEELFDCDMFVFCASKAVPALGATGDVRMVQFEANRKIVEYYGNMAKEADFKGIFAVVSDPVDPLCKAALLSSGLNPGQIKGFGLGVMNKRAEYYARKMADENSAFGKYLTEGRAFGPHGGDLVIANSIENYDDEVSKELTKLTVREAGFKPYIAPAFSSGAISLILTLRGQWNYSSVYLGNEERGAFLGIKNRYDGINLKYEDLELPEILYDRIKNAYDNLCEII